jgi:hypothetical protein
MKASLIYAVVFLLTFVLVTAVINFLNSTYYNIFKMDFRNIEDVVPEEPIVPRLHQSYYETYDVDSNNVVQKNIYHTVVRDSIVKIVVKDSALDARIDSIQSLIKELVQVNEKLKNEKPKISELDNTAKEKSVDSIYTAWIKKTAGIYNTMDPNDAAKIIESYSDNIAKDIIYTMKKKKAALVLAALNPQIAKNITRAR